MWPKRTDPALSPGVSGSRRPKSYASASGYVYEYVYRGMRKTPSGDEHVFDVAAAGEMSVLLDRSELARWSQSTKRDLSGPEQYGVVKVTLFAAFDRASSPSSVERSLSVRLADLEAAAEILDLL